jgi:hypothetical protein
MDFLLFLLGMALLGVFRPRRTFVKSLVFTLLLTRSLFDILTNYLGFVFWGFGDFAYLAENVNPALVHAVALFLIAVFTAGIGNRILSAGEVSG